jgi:integrase
VAEGTREEEWWASKRDALKLARLHRAGELTAVHIPEPTDEALRDLRGGGVRDKRRLGRTGRESRARSDATNDQRRTRQQLKAQLLRLGYKYTGKTSWNAAHERYLRELVLPHAAHKIVLEEYLQTIATAGERVARLTAQIELLARDWRLWPAIQALMSEGQVAASTQNQALSALLFLYRDVLEIDLPWLGDVDRAKRPARLPVVLTREEAQAVLAGLEGTYRLMGELLYGAGLRLLECLRLRVKDIDFSYAQITVREGKG